MNQQILDGNWNQLKGKIREQWSEITGDELEAFEGNLDQLVGMIQEKTGEAREAVERHIAAFAQNGASVAAEAKTATAAAAEQASQYTEQAAVTMRHTAEHAANSIREKYHDAEQVVKQKPLKSLALSFAAGLVFGIGATLVLRSK